MMIYLLGINSFIGKNFYLLLKKEKIDVTVLSHNELDSLLNIGNEDTLINFCGCNRGSSQEEYDEANYLFVKKIVYRLLILNVQPHLIHLSSLMVCGFQNKAMEDLPEYQQYFISSKLKGEQYLLDNYPNSTIVRPSNIFGYNCDPYYNNILVSMVYEKIVGNYKINKINRNCVRDFLSVERLNYQLFEMVTKKSLGVYHITSSTKYSLEEITLIIHQNNLPEEIEITDSDDSIPGTNHSDHVQKINCCEDIEQKIMELEDSMRKYLSLTSLITNKRLNRLSQPRGDMIEISDLSSKRLYMITLSQHSVRGNHYHYEQIEHFYQASGKTTYLLAHNDNPEIVYINTIGQDTLLVVNPYVIHTLVNDFINNDCSVFVTSTQEFIPEQVPDTKYVNII